MGDLKAQVSNLGSLGILGSNTSMVFVIVEVFVYSGYDGRWKSLLLGDNCLV